MTYAPTSTAVLFLSPSRRTISHAVTTTIAKAPHRTSVDTGRSITLCLGPSAAQQSVSPRSDRGSTIAAVRELVVDGKAITRDGPAYVIAEIGNNHQGDVERAKALIHSAKECGVDAVKLQKRDNSSLYTRALYDAPYDNEHSFGRTYGEHREASSSPTPSGSSSAEFSREEGVTLFATVFDEPSADFLAELGMPAFKIASGDLTNDAAPAPRRATGPADVPVHRRRDARGRRARGRRRSSRSTSSSASCSAPPRIRPRSRSSTSASSRRAASAIPDLVIGLSDHHSGIAMSMVGYMLGARVIEKHFTLNHAWKGTDQAFSLMPEGMRRLRP